MHSADYLLQNVVNTDIFIFEDEGIKTYGDLKSAAARLAGDLSAGTSLFFNDVLWSEGCTAWPRTPLTFDPGREASLMFTSGTTARPKVVRVTHSNIQANTDSIIRTLSRLQADFPKVIFVTVPLTLIETGPKSWLKRLFGRTTNGTAENFVRGRLNILIRHEYEQTGKLFALAQ